jgi:ABC-2 type transport system ATP-binding protein
MADVEALCKRVIVIHNGKLLFDGGLAQLLERFSAFKTISATINNETDMSQYGEVLRYEDGRVTLRVPRAETSQVTARLLAEHKVDNLTVEDTPIDDVIEKIFKEKSVEGDGR